MYPILTHNCYKTRIDEMSASSKKFSRIPKEVDCDIEVNICCQRPKKFDSIESNTEVQRKCGYVKNLGVRVGGKLLLIYLKSYFV